MSRHMWFIPFLLTLFLPLIVAPVLPGDERLLSRPGYCGATGGEEQKGCGPGKKLGWFPSTFVRIDQCLQSCAKCDECHYATFSKRMNDCSWYARSHCNLQRLQTAGNGQHRSYRVRHVNGSVLSAVAARLVRRLAASRVNGSAWVQEPARRLFFHEEDTEMLYLYSQRPDFRGDPAFQRVSRADANGPLELLREWVASIRASSFAAGASTARQHRTCAVVGSSASLLSRRHGQHIDGHDDVVKSAPWHSPSWPPEPFGRAVRLWPTLGGSTLHEGRAAGRAATALGARASHCLKSSGWPPAPSPTPLPLAN